MGTDIHAAIEYRVGGKWAALLTKNKYFGKYDDESTARFDIDRDYDLFSILANVRNGHGFAGCKTSDGFDAMTSKRGLPDDISVGAKESGCTGDHSDTYVTLKEILDYDWTKSTTKFGFVNAVQFERWDRMREWIPGPEEYCGDVTGAKVVKVLEDEMRAYVRKTIGVTCGSAFQQALKNLNPHMYTRISWQESYSKAGEQLWHRVLPVMLKVAKEHEISYENVRLVVNFDS